MPELPEVETVRRQLAERLNGATVAGIDVWRSGREFPQGDEFIQMLVGQRIETVERRAKLLVWRLMDGRAMMAHLKMTGRFVFVDDEYARGKHDRICFFFEKDGERFLLVWADVRQFGFLKVVERVEIDRILAGYGPEPLEASFEVLASCLFTDSSRTVKSLLLDQAVIAGIGNIYADEALHRAGIRPTRRVKRLSGDDRLRLAREIQVVLRASLAQQGTSANDYVDTKGERGGFLALLRVYGRGGEPCLVCGLPIHKTVVAQRGTHYCKRCQS
jgi:formamidopyrimidine-DNA glycosylase